MIHDQEEGLAWTAHKIKFYIFFSKREIHKLSNAVCYKTLAKVLIELKNIELPPRLGYSLIFVAAATLASI